MIIAFTNQKGGVGKTTTTLNVGAGLVELGKKVLLVDLDPQANLTYALGYEAHSLKLTVYELLHGRASLEETLLKREGGLALVPSSLRLSVVERELYPDQRWATVLRRRLYGAGLERFDYVLLDCPPSLGLLTVNALALAQAVIIALQTEPLALQGMAQLLETIGEVTREPEPLNGGLKLAGIVATQHNKRSKLHQEVIELIRKDFAALVFHTVIRQNVALAEASSAGQTIFEYRKTSNGAEDYLALCKEITRRKL